MDLQNDCWCLLSSLQLLELYPPLFADIIGILKDFSSNFWSVDFFFVLFRSAVIVVFISSPETWLPSFTTWPFLLYFGLECCYLLNSFFCSVCFQVFLEFATTDKKLLGMDIELRSMNIVISVQEWKYRPYIRLHGRRKGV